MAKFDPNFKWDDQACDVRKAFICKTSATQDGSTNCPDCGVATEPPGVCKCYVYVLSGFGLADKDIFHITRVIIPLKFGISFDRIPTEKYFRAGLFSRRKHQNAHSGQPDNGDFKENCVEMWGQDPNFKWNDGPCDYKKAFICKATATQDGNINCPDCGDATEPPGVCK